MNSRERVVMGLQHKEADRVPLDLGAMLSTGITGITYNELKAYLGIHAPVRVGTKGMEAQHAARRLSLRGARVVQSRSAA